MYIAFKYLVGMAVTMWVLLCCLDIYWKKSTEEHFDIDFQKLLLPSYENTSIIQENLFEPKNEINIYADNLHDNIHLQFFMYFVGVCMVFIINRRDEIITLTKGRFNYLNYDTTMAYLRLNCMYLKKTVKEIRDTMIMFLKNMYSRLKVNKVHDVNFNLILLNKLKELNQEHRNLSDILIPTIQENKNLRMQFYLKSVCNDENVIYNVFSQKITVFTENRYANVGFQKLYLMTHRENIFLRSRLKNITQEKEDAERKLIKLVNRVCQSKNNDLKAYCSQFIVQTTNNLLNSDVRAEIQKFLEKSSDDAYFPVNRLSEQMNSLKLTECINSENPITAKDNAPKLKSAFETQVQNYVWTVKDKDGIIEKLYEYQSDSQNGTIIRRIRQYSVYYDTERVVDLSDSTTVIDHQKADVSNLLCVTNQRFLSGSQAFKNFLLNNKSIVLKQSRSPKSSICIAT